MRSDEEDKAVRFHEGEEGGRRFVIRVSNVTSPFIPTIVTQWWMLAKLKHDRGMAAAGTSLENKDPFGTNTMAPVRYYSITEMAAWAEAADVAPFEDGEANTAEQPQHERVKEEREEVDLRVCSSTLREITFTFMATSSSVDVRRPQAAEICL